jgi:hypothetical protein
MMSSCWYLVIESMGSWWVDCEGKPFGPFEEMDEATQGAIKLAEIFGDPDRQALVMAPDEAGHFHIVWEGERPHPAPN